ncbi:MAG: DUF4037 domain-containing protein [Firmicutes bacterium]|nr:DUF4037 domain-containing protein [Bacillota bacterium]
MYLPIPDEMPPEKQAVLVKAVESLRTVDGIAAIVLGGSYARGTQHPESDIDIGIYYRESSPFSIDAIRKAARSLSHDGVPVVTDFYEWGPWVNGGAWISTRAGKVDFLYRNLDQVMRTIDQAQQGVYEHDYNQQPTFGFYSVTYLGETHVCIPLVDPQGWIAGLKSKVKRYPPKLKRAVVATELWKAEFALLFADAYAAKGDVYNTVGCLARICGCLTQALFALNEKYFMNDKGALEIVERFILSPPDYRERVSRLLASSGSDPNKLVETVTAVREIWSEIVALSGDLYQSKYFGKDPTDG